MNASAGLFSDDMELKVINISSLLQMIELVFVVCNGTWVMPQSHSGTRDIYDGKLSLRYCMALCK
jgi:hypothetical protein